MGNTEDSGCPPRVDRSCPEERWISARCTEDDGIPEEARRPVQAQDCVYSAGLAQSKTFTRSLCTLLPINTGPSFHRNQFEDRRPVLAGHFGSLAWSLRPVLLCVVATGV